MHDHFFLAREKFFLPPVTSQRAKTRKYYGGETGSLPPVSFFTFFGKIFIREKNPQPGGLRIFFKIILFKIGIKEKQIGETREKPQWIVAQRLLSHLQYPDLAKSSAKNLPSVSIYLMMSWQ